jgi:hypothetical protein
MMRAIIRLTKRRSVLDVLRRVASPAMVGLVSAGAAGQCDPAGLFAAEQEYIIAGASSRPAAAGDLDGDGVPDIAVVQTNDSTLSLLMGRGDGTFQVRRDYGTGAQPRVIAVGDLNGDGTPDLTVANSVDETVSVLLGNADGTFQPAQDVAAGFGPWGVAIGGSQR